MPTDTKRNFDWSGRMEQLEDRLFMSADPVGGFLGGAIEQHAIVDAPPALDHHTESTPDFWIESSDQVALDEHLRQIDQALEEAHGQTGLLNVRNNYGFTGIGQTVAVIDSGIAYDHFALGGGLGSNYRVVGGWDFTGENDADPYDDGPSGSHGTHVAGIVGGDSGNDTGVAPGVDLVGLRVFDDAGAGYFSWVENALDWVHTNRNNFENPITAINLSLGVSSWNSDTIPNWANLEDEFAQLEADGIFIAVSAGNSFTSFNSAGLSYPAASSHVVPVMSTDDSGLMSYFSQRHSRAIAAPGRWITSTVPDYAGNNNGVADDYASMSGTSMAAPYVAGASVIIREAMEFVGYTNITQDTIYDHMMATADSFFDSATSQSYSRLNVQSAIDALMPSDDFGSDVASAYGLGTVSTPMSMSGTIATLNDVDYFAFTAGSTGTVTFETTSTSHDLTASWLVTGTQSLGTQASTGDSVTLDVVAGQDYTVGFASEGGLGHYDFDVSSDSSFTFTDWGTVEYSQLADIAVSGETWYRFAATNSGYMTVDSIFDGGAGQVGLELYNSGLQLIDTGNAISGTSRVDAYVAAGDELYVKVVGTNSNVDFRLTNLVSLSGTAVNVAGTTGDDTFAFAAGSMHAVSVNGVTYSFDSVAINEINFDGGAGNDSIALAGTSGDETAHIHSTSVEFAGSGLTVAATNVEEKTVVSNGGAGDIAYFYDTFGDETFDAYSDHAVMQGTGFRSEAVGFATTWAYASLGADTAVLHDGATDDRFVAGKNYALMLSISGEFFNYATGFDVIQGEATAGGQDYATLHGSTEDEQFVGRESQSEISYDGGAHSNIAIGFDAVFAYGNGGTDTATLYDAATDDLFIATDSWAVLQDSAGSFSNYAAGFSHVDAYASAGGNDIAYLYDGAGDDRFVAGSNYALIGAVDGSFYNYSAGFDSVFAIASLGGVDIATLYDSAGKDVFTSQPTYTVMTDAGQTYYNHTTGFDSTLAYSTLGGNDEANLHGGAGDDILSATSDYAILYDTAGSYVSLASGFSDVSAFGGGGNNVADLFDGVTDDRFVAGPLWGLMVSTTGEFSNYVSGFQKITGYATNGGQDIATFYDSNSDDRFTSSFASSVMEDLAATYQVVGNGFDEVYAYASGGNDIAILRDSSVDDLLFGRDDYAYLLGGGRMQYSSGFETVRGESTVGGTDIADVEVIEYIFDQIGGWI